MLRVVANDRIADTLQTIGDLKRPVSRSCHIGNNGNYNFAWLALARNTRFVMYDHTTYGVDRVCFPWMLVRDYGIIDTAFDIEGQPRHDLRGQHVGALAARAPARHRSILNYGIKATVDNVPLFAYHFSSNCQFAKQYNDQEHTFDAKEVLANFHICENIILQFARKGELHMLFDRWVAQRKGRTLMEHIREIHIEGDDILITNTTGRPLFQGDAQGLVHSLNESLNAVVSHITNGDALPPISYPWFNLVFSYLFGAIIEHTHDWRQTSFFHAGGLTSPYYMTDAKFQQRFHQLTNRLQTAGFLPQEFDFNVIPIGCCQLYASSTSLASLEDLILCAKDALRTVASARELECAFQQSESHIGQDLIPMLLQRMRPSIRTKLRELTLRFNSDCPNRLPVCLRNSSINTFTKYGVGGVHSRSLREDAIIFPRSLLDLTWCEGECIVQALGHLFAHVPEDPYAANDTLAKEVDRPTS